MAESSAYFTGELAGKLTGEFTGKTPAVPPQNSRLKPKPKRFTAKLGP